MFSKLSIKNFKSIASLEIDLGRINVFIGENGCGKSNILEAVGLFAASRSGELSPEELFNRGIRVAKPSLMFNSFKKKKSAKSIEIELLSDKVSRAILLNDNPDDIYSIWYDTDKITTLGRIAKKVLGRAELNELNIKDSDASKLYESEGVKTFFEKISKEIEANKLPEIQDYVIYNLNTVALRGLNVSSKRLPLGINGEGLDTLLGRLDNSEIHFLKKNNFIAWMENYFVDPNEILKHKGLKLGRSVSQLYFSDKYMAGDNNVFSAENANEGALHVLFYLTLFASKITPKFFAIDNIETALNPKLCRELIKSLANLAAISDKQALITTHNPAILDGLNLNDPNQRLFVVKRKDDGQTTVEQIKLKPEAQEGKFKLSELWMRGHLGGLPVNF